MLRRDYVASRLRLLSVSLALFGALLAVSLPASAHGARATSLAHLSSLAPDQVPAVDPNYVYAQLFTMATHYLRRETGYDASLPPTVNGHDEFATYWTQEILRDLSGFGPQARRDSFAAEGWLNRPPVVPGFNVEVTVPGETQATQMVVVGCHYDSEADSTQSAYDDASGCAIELGIARALAGYWRAQHAYPARTLRFILFDGEEQGIDGSFHYVNSTILGELSSVVAMFDEEQSGIGYPLRFLGQMANPLLLLYAYETPLAPNDWYPMVNTFSSTQRAAIQQFRQLVPSAVTQAFSALRALGYTTLSYTDGAGHAVAQPIFTPDQLQNVLVRDDILGSSDQVPFTWAGIPCLTLNGNYSYYPEFGGQSPPPWSYPFDQPQDTIQLMNIYAGGSTQKSEALALALALPGSITTQLLAQSELVGQAPGDGAPIAVLGDLGPVVVGQAVTFSVGASFEPSANGPLTYQWAFGDGATAFGVSAQHIYQAVGSYRLTLTVRSASGQRQLAQPLEVATQPVTYEYDHPTWRAQDGVPPANPAVHLPSALPPPVTSVGTSPSPGGWPWRLMLALAALALLAAGALLLGALRWRARAAAPLPLDEARVRRLQTLHDLAEK
jgi:hypothetical protein